MSNHTNWPARFAEMLDLVGLSEEDRQLIKASNPLIMLHAGRLNDLVYEQLLQHPQSRKFFVTADDKPDAKRIEDNKQTMITWLRATATAPLNEGFVRYLVGISQMHRNIPIHRPHLSPVAPPYHRDDFVLSDRYSRHPAPTDAGSRLGIPYQCGLEQMAYAGPGAAIGGLPSPRWRRLIPTTYWALPGSDSF